MAIATLSIDLEARLAKFEQGLDRAARLAEKNAEQQRAAWARVGATVTGVAGTIAGAFAGVSAMGWLREQADALDALNDAADATGASIENLSALESIGKSVGTQFDTITGILVKFNGVLADAKPGSAQAEALKAIGLQAAELQRLDPAEALRRTAVALAGFADDGNKARLVQDLFGKSVREAAPFLKDLAEAGELNGKTTRAQAEAAEAFNKQLFEFQKHSAETGRAIANNLLPWLTELIKQFGDARREYGSFIDALLDQGLNVNPTKTLNENLTATAQEIAAVKKEIATTQNMRGGWFLGEAAADEDLKNLREQLRLLEARERVLRQRQAREGGGRGQITPLNLGEDKPVVGEYGKLEKEKKAKDPKPDEAALALGRYVAEQQRALDQAVELTEQQKALNLLRELGTTGEIPQVRELVLGLADKLKALRDEEEIQKGIKDYLDKQAAATKQLDEALDRWSGRSGDALKRLQTERLEARIQAGEKFTDDELEKIVNGIAGITKEKVDAVDEFTKQAARNIQDALGDTLLQTLDGKFDGILDLWANLLKRMAAEALGAQLGKYLLGDFGKTGELGGLAGKGLGSLLDWIMPESPFWARGGAFDAAGPIKAFAAGDVFDRATLFGYGGSRLGVLGEAGPEAIMPLRRGADGKLGVASAGGGGSPKFYFSFPIQAGVSPAELAQLIPVIEERTKASVFQAMRRPGSAFRN